MSPVPRAVDEIYQPPRAWEATEMDKPGCLLDLERGGPLNKPAYTP